MNKEAVDIWIKALRSGMFPQTERYLVTTEGYCCLGVACNLYNNIEGGLDVTFHEAEVHDVDDPTDISAAHWEYNGETSILPETVREWLGLKSYSGELIIYNNDGSQDDITSLASLNDRGLTFDQIADVIEFGPTNLFRKD